jgi:hypothetical protein
LFRKCSENIFRKGGRLIPLPVWRLGAVPNNYWRAASEITGFGILLNPISIIA